MGQPELLQAAGKEQARAKSLPKITIRFRAQDRIFPLDPEVVVLRSLSLREDMDIAQAHGSKAELRTMEQTKRAIVSVDGRKLDQGLSEHDVFMEQVSPKVRQLLMISYSHFFYAQDVDSFLAECVTIEAST